MACIQLNYVTPKLTLSKEVRTIYIVVKSDGDSIVITMSLRKTELVCKATRDEKPIGQARIEAERTIEKALSIIEEQWECLGESITSPEDARRYFKLKLSCEKQEVFTAFFLTSKHQTIAFEILFRGTIDNSPVYPRVVAQRALELNAAAIIVGHNHPSGVPKPRNADIAINKRLYEALELFNVKLLDHLIVGCGEPTSLAERVDLMSVLN